MASGITKSVTSVATTATPAAETVVNTITAPSTGPGQQVVTIHASLTQTTGTTTTGVTLRVRRGSLTGALVGVAQADGIFAAAAAAVETHSIDVQDQPGDTSGQVYVLTCANIGAGAAGAAIQSTMVVECGP